MYKEPTSVYSSWIIFSKYVYIYIFLQYYLFFLPRSKHDYLDLLDKLDNSKDNSLAHRHELHEFRRKMIKSRIGGIKRGWFFVERKDRGGEKNACRRRKSIHGARYRDTLPLVNLVSRRGRVPRGFQQARPLISIIITSLYVFEPVDLRCRVAQLMRIGAAYISANKV